MMTPDAPKGDARKRRLTLIVSLLVAASALGFVAFGNIGENLVYYWDSSQLVAAGDDAIGPTIRLGGVVQEGSLDWRPDDSELHFVVSDGKNTVSIHSSGAPPQMFREGIGVVVEGTMTKSGVFESRRLMVKHSNEYRAPEEGTTVEELYKTVESM
jgi:cytochrome c-type biogenesis protein CcmE